jgi:hypothetical protein
MALHIDTIREDYEKGRYTMAINCAKMFPEDYVFDENLSVKRNRELVVERNQEVTELRKQQRNKQLELTNRLREDVTAYIEENYELSNRQAHLVESWVYSEKHSFMCDYFSSIDSFADFAETIVNCTIDD